MITTMMLSLAGIAVEGSPTPSCHIPPYSSYGYCNQSWTAGDRARDLVSRMNLTEKSLSIYQNNQGVPRLGVPQFRFGEALHGVMSECGNQTYFKEFGGNNTGCATSFPHALMMACSFNRSLWSAVGTTVSTESRALANQGLAGIAFWTPDINMARDPRWGRSQEVPSEDPFLSGEYGSAFVHAFQTGTPDESKKYLKAVATAKHFQDYNCETCWGCNEPAAVNGSCDRGAFNAKITVQDQVEYFWPAWEATVRDGKVKSVMCSYNGVNGIPSCGNPQMNTILRDKWGFDGFITSDCSAINDPFFNNYVKTNFNNSKPKQAAIAMEAGCDFNCGQFYTSYLVGSVTGGFISTEDVDRAITRVWEQAFALGLLSDDVPYHHYGPELVDSPSHRDLVLSAAQQSMVLLRNSPVGSSNKPILPLKESDFLRNTSSSKSIALIGPHYNVTQEMLSIYHGPDRCNRIVNSMSPFMVFTRAGLNVKHAPGCVGTDGEDPSGDTACLDKSGFAAAVELAKTVDIPILFMGLTPGAMNNASSEAHESEGWDRHTINLPGYQEELVKEIFAVNPNTVVVLIHALQLSSDWMYANVNAILDAHYPGELGGISIYNAIFGKYSPAGRLSTTIYPESFVSTRNISNMEMRAARGITYRYYLDKAVVPFGFGLSYTTFKFEVENNRENTALRTDLFTSAMYRVKVTNTGTVSSDVSVLGFSQSADKNQPGHADSIPNPQLFDFDRIYLTPGESKTVLLTIPASSLGITNINGRKSLFPGTYKLFFGVEGSAEGTPATATLTLEGSPRTLFEL
eukprot:TRINITY_DN21185_c0_g1_i1.p1 TRINITY_DN21185_c0_g1~~TRINITY_DN21185_c0_g1_i1.p1  ORF type:complete len:799 (+),score=106.49 TRINITY_DN21185_c0_g1_i1:168-2564(+)